MSNTEAGGNAGLEVGAFSPRGYLLGLLQNLVQSGQAACISWPGKGELIVLPGRKAYYSRVQDMAALCRAPADSFQVETCDEATALSRASGARGRLRELLWQAAFYASQGRMIEGCSRFDVVKLLRWPNLTRLPVTPNTARICALLTHHPCTIMLVPRVLVVEPGEVNQVYSAAFCCGSAQVVGRHTPAQQTETAEPELAEVESRTAQGKGFLRTLFEKISGL